MFRRIRDNKVQSDFLLLPSCVLCRPRTEMLWGMNEVLGADAQFSHRKINGALSFGSPSLRSGRHSDPFARGGGRIRFSVAFCTRGRAHCVRLPRAICCRPLRGLTPGTPPIWQYPSAGRVWERGVQQEQANRAPLSGCLRNVDGRKCRNDRPLPHGRGSPPSVNGPTGIRRGRDRAFPAQMQERLNCTPTVREGSSIRVIDLTAVAQRTTHHCSNVDHLFEHVPKLIVSPHLRSGYSYVLSWETSTIVARRCTGSPSSFNVVWQPVQAQDRQKEV